MLIVMRYLISFIFLFPTILFGQISHINLEVNKIIGTIEDEPQKNDLIIFWPVSSCLDEDKNLFVLDAGNSRVLMFDNKYRLISQFGRKGRGPGEFLFQVGDINPGCLCISNDKKIFIADNLNSRVQSFDYKGNFNSSFKVPWKVNDMEIDENSNIFMSGISGINKKLFYIFDKNGEYVRAFGKELITEKNVNNPFIHLANKLHFTFCNHNILLIFEFWPILRNYDQSGNLLWEKSLELESQSPVIKNMYEKIRLRNPPINQYVSYLENKKNRNSKYRFGSKVKDIYFSNNKIYLLINPNSIVELSENGHLLNIYIFDYKNNSPILNFLVNNEEFLIFRPTNISIFKKRP